MGYRFEGIGIPPALRAAHIVGNGLCEELGFRSTLHRVAIPVEVQLRKIDEAGRSEVYALEFTLGSPGAGMIPRTDNKKMGGGGRGRRPKHVTAVGGEGP